LVYNSNIKEPKITNDGAYFNNIGSGYIEISPDNTNAVNQVQWQISTNSNFIHANTVNVWGNITRKKNIYYQDNGTIEGKEIDTQKNKNIFKLELSKVHGKHFERDEIRKWTKDSAQQTHTSDYKPSNDPVVIYFRSGKRYYWRARVRDINMNWSDWSNDAYFNMK